MAGGKEGAKRQLAHEVRLREWERVVEVAAELERRAKHIARRVRNGHKVGEPNAEQSGEKH